VIPFERIEVYGDKGVLRWENGKLQHYQAEKSLSEDLSTNPEAFGHINGEWHDIEANEAENFGGDAPGGSQSIGGHNGVIYHFADAVLNNDESKLIAQGEDGVASLELANAILLAGVTEKTVTFPLDRDTYADALSKLQNGELKITHA
jgi:predicted dehydrogenase